MINTHDPRWLNTLSRHLSWLAVPHISIILVTLQALGFMLFTSNPEMLYYLPLDPSRVMGGEIWRLVTFLSIPLSHQLIWMFFSLWFLYSIVNSIEEEWGAFKTTLYILVSIILTIVFSFIFQYPVTQVQDFTSTLFLAAAALFPEMQISFYMVIPVKIKYLGYLALAFLAFRLFQGDWLDRLFILTIYSNYFIFFGPSLLFQIRDWKRRRDFRSKWRS